MNSQPEKHTSQSAVNRASRDTAHEGYEGWEFDIVDFLRTLLKYWWLCILLALLGAGVMFVKDKVLMTPQYTSSVTFTVQTEKTEGGISSYAFQYSLSTAEQLEETFPAIIQSNILHEIIKNDLGLSRLPVSFSANSVEGTTMFTINVTGRDPELTYDILMSTIKNYPAVAEVVIGNTSLEIITPPVVPTTPSNLNDYLESVPKGALAGLVLALTWVLLYSIFRNTIRTRGDIRAKLNSTCTATVPEMVFRKYNRDIDRSVLVTNSFVNDGFRESIRSLRNALLRSLKPGSVIMFSSTAPGEGKTTVAVNLALSLAQSGKKILIADCDVRNPSVANTLGITLPTGENTKFSVTSCRTGDCEYDVLTFNDNDNGSIWELIRVNYLRELFNRTRAAYDYVIVDTAPCGLTSEPSVIAEAVDGIYYVIRHDTIRTNRISSSIDSLTSSGTKLLGCVLNGDKDETIGYGSSYRYGKYGYGKYGYGGSSKN